MKKATRGIGFVSTSKRLHGYVLVEMVLDDQSWFVVRNTPSFNRVEKL